MAERIDYTKIADKLNYPALEKKLDELREKAPPKRRKQAADVLAPVTANLLELHTKGWSYQQLAEELKASGLPVTVSALRVHLTKAGKSQKAKAKPAASKA
jgi:hypothetical protein